MSSFYILSIKKITKETHNSVSITFNIPESLKSHFSFIPGQYITIQTTINDEQIRRDYSICSSSESGEIRVGVKAIENGTFSQFAVHQLKEGDELEVSTPQGRFNLITDNNNAKNYIAFAAGSGITPILSMVKSVLEIESNSKFVLVYGNKTAEDIMFKSDLDECVIAHKDRFFINYIFSKTSYNDHFHGRIDASILSQILERNKELNFDDYFLCGPEPMINLIKDTLKEQKIADSKVHFELFTTSTESSEEIESLEGESEITVLLDDEEETFKMPKSSTILEQALLKGLDAPYSCQGGICSTCIAKITEGKAKMEKNSILTEDEINDGLILTCQAHPTTSKITVDYDDV